MAMRYPLQSALPTCKHHLNEELNYYCQTCNLRVCEECIQGRHANHKWMSNKKFARLVRQNTGARCEELEDIIRGLELGNEDVEMEADIDRIEDVRRKWIQTINDRADMLKAKRRAGRSRKISTEEMTKLKKMLKFFRQDLKEADDNVAVEMEEEFHKKKQNVSPPSKTTEKKLVFKEGTLSTDDINYMFGEVVEDIKESKQLPIPSTIKTISNTSTNMAMIFPLQSALPTCKDHLNEELNYYCQTCNLRVCEECLQGLHANHKWMSNKKFARLVRENTGARCEELEDMVRRLEIDNEDVKMEVDIDRIEEVRRKWIQAINDRADMLKEKRRAGRSRKISAEEMTKLKKMLKFFKQDLKEADDNVAVEMEEEFHKKKQNVSPPSKTTEKKLVFKEGTLSTDDINYMFGDVVEDIKESKVNVIEKSHFTHIDDSDCIYCIVPLTNDEALITRDNDDHIYHVEITGNTIKELPYDVGYFTMLDNDIVYTYFRGKIIRRITPAGTESDISSTTPLHPVGICKSYNGGLMVTLCSCDGTEITSDSYGEVHHIDISGGIINKYTHTEDRKSKLFICPHKVAQNKNTDMCVVEHIDREYRSRLVCVSMLSQVRFTYTGQPALTKKFSCNDIACDHHGRILLADILNHAVHLLREDGHFLQYVLTEQSPLKLPMALGLHGGTLWVGCQEGVVRVYKYSDEKR